MSLSTQTRIRLPKIQEGLRQGLTHDQIAENCGVTSRTIERDLDSWYESGEFETWLKAEFVELYEYVRTANPTIAFKELARLMGKMVTRKAEIKTESIIEEKKEVHINFDAMSKEERELYRNLFRKHYMQPSEGRSDTLH
jgi:DNA-binding transcriptional regulator LsrR (DeoR family)